MSVQAELCYIAPRRPPREAKGNCVGQVKRASGGRESFTAGLVFGPMFKGYGVSQRDACAD